MNSTTDFLTDAEADTLGLPQLPPGTETDSLWTRSDDGFVRSVFWPARSTENAMAHLTAAQYSDGRPIQRFVSASFSGLGVDTYEDLLGRKEVMFEVTPAVARQLAAVLLAAAEGVR